MHIYLLSYPTPADPSHCHETNMKKPALFYSCSRSVYMPQRAAVAQVAERLSDD